jgi:spermidine/putrescine transport system permease protein
LNPHKKLEVFSPAALLLFPAGLWLAIFLLIPLAILAVCSLGSRDEVGRLVLGCTLSNYQRFFAGPYLLSLWRSITLASLTTLACLLVGLCFAIWLTFNVPKGRRNLYLTLFTAPLWTSFLLRIYAWMIILRPTGILAAACEGLKISAPQLMYNYGAVLLGMVYNYLPYMVLPLYAALEKLDQTYLEAAADLGATPLQSFVKVTVPLSSRGIVAGCIMVFIPALGDYVTPDLLGGAKTMFIGNLIQNQFLTIRDWAFGSAVSTILIVIVGIAVWIYLKYGETSYARPSTN